MNSSKGKFTAIALMFLSLVLDGFIASYWAVRLDTDYGLMIPRFIFLIFILLSYHYDNKFMMTSAFLFGILMDSYYLGFFGISIASLVMIVYIINNVKKILQSSMFSYVLLSILVITVVESFIYGVIRLLEITAMSYQEFLVSKLAATLLFNSIAMLLFGYFIHQFIRYALDKNSKSR